MSANIRFAHVNLVAKDWRKLAEFYEKMFGCIPVPPKRNLKGEWLDRGTGVPDAHITGTHLKLPGYPNDGPTIEILSYDHILEKDTPVANVQGFGHLAFEVGNVEKKRASIIEKGGGAIGEVVTVDIPHAGKLTWCYVTDPERNIIELQKWEN